VQITKDIVNGPSPTLLNLKAGQSVAKTTYLKTQNSGSRGSDGQTVSIREKHYDDLV
jgi:hypothetical protein